MFRLKVFPIIQNILNRNVYNTIHKNHIQCTLFSTGALNRSSAGSSIDASNENSDGTSINASNKSQTETTTKTPNENIFSILNKPLDQILMESIANKSKTRNASNGNLFKTRIEDKSDRIKGKSDKLYKKIEIEVRGNDKAVLQSYGEFAVTAAKHLDINVYRNVALRKAVHERLTVLKSAFGHKKHRVQYETRTYYRYLDFLNLTGSTADTFLEYIQRNLPEGVAMKVTMVELQTLPETVKQAVPSQ